jgi:penicillin amidase
MVMADRSGRIAWTIYGSIPRREGFDGSLPTSWADGSRGWNGWLPTSDYPRLLDPPDGRIWTANARVVDGAMLGKLGDGSYEIGSRASEIRNRLRERDHFSVRDLLNIQLDTRASFLERWRGLILKTLTPQALASNNDRKTFRDIVDRGWNGNVSADSVAYRLVRMFREQVAQQVIAFAMAECYEADQTFDYMNVRRREGPIWKLVTEKPQHLLDPRYSSWDELLVSSIDSVIEQSSAEGLGGLAERRWSEYNVTAYRHPLSPALPFVGRWLDMPTQPLPGDLYTPRVHWGSIAASERMIVSPGREQDGIMHMPTGQSGHPLSPFYSNSHDAWVKGEPTPFLPGATVHTLTLTP